MPRTRIKLVVLIILIATAVAGGFWAYGVHQKPEKTASPNEPKIPASVATAERKDFPIYLSSLGDVQAWNTVTVRSRVDGEITKIAFDEGQFVKQGDLLIQIDPRPFQAALDQATAKKTQDEANLDLASGRLDAVLADKFVILPWLEKSDEGKCCQVIGMDVRDPKYFGTGIGAGMRKDDRDLKTLVDQGIAAIRANGTYDRVNAKYFPFSLY